MNQRIQELAKQAGEYVNSVYTQPIRSKTPGKIWEDGHIDWHTQFNEKFAQLIISKCLEACSRAVEIRHFVPPTQEQVVLNCMREIERIFGGIE